jgi:hypothetical protein
MSAAPAVNSEYEVELDIPGRLIWGEQINVTESTTPAILERDGETLVFGTLQRSDGSAAELRLGEELILVEVDRVECQLPCDVVVKTHQLRLFDANI